MIQTIHNQCNAVLSVFFFYKSSKAFVISKEKKDRSAVLVTNGYRLVLLAQNVKPAIKFKSKWLCVKYLSEQLRRNLKVHGEGAVFKSEAELRSLSIRQKDAVGRLNKIFWFIRFPNDAVKFIARLERSMKEGTKEYGIGIRSVAAQIFALSEHTHITGHRLF